MLEIEEQLRHYGRALEDELVGQTAPTANSRRHRHRHRPAMALAAVLVVLAAVAAVLANRGNDGHTDVATTTNTKGTFSTDTGVVLLFTDGIDGVAAVDLDTRIAGRRVIEGERAGDQAYRLTIAGNHVVVGWGEIYSQPLDGGPASKIADATIYLPASEYGQVWTVTWPGGGIGQGPATVRSVTATGDATATFPTLDTAAAFPLLGVPGGLAVRTTDGRLAIWDAATGTTGPPLGPGDPTAVASDGRQLAWCEGRCTTVHVAPLERTGPPPAPHVASGNHLAMTRDGKRLAFIRDDDLVSRDLATGAESVVAENLPPYGSILWTDDGRQLFFAGRQGHLGRYVVATGRWEERDVPVGQTGGAVAVTPAQARSFFNPNLVPPDQCPGAGSSYPSGRKGVCSFRY